jgi:hypothetical protein
VPSAQSATAQAAFCPITNQRAVSEPRQNTPITAPSGIEGQDLATKSSMPSMPASFASACHLRRWLRSSVLSPLKERNALGRVACKSSRPPQPSPTKPVSLQLDAAIGGPELPHLRPRRTNPNQSCRRQTLPRKGDDGICNVSTRCGYTARQSHTCAAPLCRPEETPAVAGSVTQQSTPFEWRRPWANHDAPPNMHIGQTGLRLHGLPPRQRVVVPVVTGTTLPPPPPALPTT